MKRGFSIHDLRASIAEKPILLGIDLEIRPGEIHALMGPNGSGKSTLANVLMGHPSYTVGGGQVLLDGEDFLTLSTDERARKGVFLAFQYPVEITGITVGKFLKRAVEMRPDSESEHTDPKSTKVLDVSAFIRDLRSNLEFLEIDQEFINRYLNQGFSGGEKKRMEIAQMMMLSPRFAILDETDSGLDIDALKLVAKGVNRLRGPDFSALIITHYQRILDHIKPDFVHIMYRGRIVYSGGVELVEALEQKGYEWIKEQVGIEEDKYEQSAAIQ